MQIRELSLPEIEVITGGSNGAVLTSGSYDFWGGAGGGEGDEWDSTCFGEGGCGCGGDADAGVTGNGVYLGNNISNDLAVVIDGGNFTTSEVAAINSALYEICNNLSTTFTDPVTGQPVTFAQLLAVVAGNSIGADGNKTLYIGHFAGSEDGAGGTGVVDNSSSIYDGILAVGVIPSAASAAHASSNLIDDIGTVIVHELLHIYLQYHHGIPGDDPAYEVQVRMLDDAIWDAMRAN